MKSLRHYGMAAASRKTRNSQWKQFFDFCSLYDLQPLPASVDTVSLFVAYLSSRLEYSTVVNYVASLAKLHHENDFDAPDLGHFSVKEALAGLQRSRLELPNRKSPLLPCHLLQIFEHLHLVPSNMRVNFLVCMPNCFLLFTSAKQPVLFSY